jgi:hypothetical protein
VSGRRAARSRLGAGLLALLLWSVARVVLLGCGVAGGAPSLAVPAASPLASSHAASHATSYGTSHAAHAAPHLASHGAHAADASAPARGPAEAPPHHGGDGATDCAGALGCGSAAVQSVVTVVDGTWGPRDAARTWAREGEPTSVARAPETPPPRA